MPHVIRIQQNGGPEQMHWEEVTVGEPGPGEVRVRNTAIGLNFIDTYHRSGLYPMPLPMVLGSEGAGVVEAVGPKVKEFKVGDRVEQVARIVPLFFGLATRRIRRNLLDHRAARTPPFGAARFGNFRHRQPHARRNLVRLREPGLRAVSQRRALDRHHALPRRLIRVVRLQQQRKHARAKHLRNMRPLALVDPVEIVPLGLVEPQIAAHAAIGARLSHHQRHRATALRLHHHAAIELQRSRHQHRQRHRLAKQVSRPARIIMPLEYGIEHPVPQTRNASADRGILDLERRNEVIACAQRIIWHRFIGHFGGAIMCEHPRQMGVGTHGFNPSAIEPAPSALPAKKTSRPLNPLSLRSVLNP